jgi:hypothetical protein
MFGGRLLRPTAAVDIATVEAAAPESEGRGTPQRALPRIAAAATGVEWRRVGGKQRNR